MAYPLNVKTRLVSFGGAATVEAGIPLHIRISTESSRSLIWVENGYRLESLAALYMSATDGQEIVFEVPTTDQNGWLDAATRQAIIVDPGEASHLYMTKLEIFTEDHELIRTYEIGPYAVPEGPGTLDADLLNPNYDPIEGTLTVYIPGPDGELSAAGQQAAADAVQAAIDAEGYRDEAEMFSATTVELQDAAIAQAISTPGTDANGAVDDLAVLGALRGDPSRRFRVVSGVLRNDGAGWYVLDDPAHRATGVLSVETRIDAIRVHFSGDAASKVVAAIPNPSTELVRAGIQASQSIATDYVDFRLTQRGGTLADRVRFNGTDWVSDNGVFTMSWNAEGRLAINHMDDLFTSIPDRYCMSLFPRGGKYHVSLASSTPVGNAIRDNGVSIEFRTALGGAQVLTPDTDMDVMFARWRPGGRLLNPATVTTAKYPYANLSFIVLLEDG